MRKLCNSWRARRTAWQWAEMTEATDNGSVVRGFRLVPGLAYRSEAVNLSHASALNVSVMLSRLVVSRTITPCADATSTH